MNFEDKREFNLWRSEQRARMPEAAQRLFSLTNDWGHHKLLGSCIQGLNDYHDRSYFFGDCDDVLSARLVLVVLVEKLFRIIEELDNR